MKSNFMIGIAVCVAALSMSVSPEAQAAPPPCNNSTLGAFWSQIQPTYYNRYVTYYKYIYHCEWAPGNDGPEWLYWDTQICSNSAGTNCSSL